MKKCPKCTDVGLKTAKLKNRNLELDRCPECKGLWFDQGELDTVLGVKAVKDFSIPQFAIQNPKTPCPICAEGLYEFCYPGTMVLIDACRYQHGIWLDNDEWKEIAIARDIKNQITCPKCSTKQRNSDSCSNCGFVFNSRAESETHQSNENMHSTQATEGEPTTRRVSYADDVPGIKGVLLRFIDRTIEELNK